MIRFGGHLPKGEDHHDGHDRRTRRSFNDYKTGAVRLVLDEGKTVASAARDLLDGVVAAELGRAGPRGSDKGKTGLTTAEREELARLRKEVRELRMERRPKKSRGLLREGPPVKFAWIQTRRPAIEPPGGSARPTHAREDRRLKVLVQASFAESKQRYGSPRIHADLIEQDEQVSRKRVIRLMQENGLKARTRKRSR